MRVLFDREGWALSGTLTGIDEDDPEIVFWRRRDNPPTSNKLRD
ncbi:MAG: hypothetical protein ACRDVC_11015 [Acidimicrobiales bacterium]